MRGIASTARLAVHFAPVETLADRSNERVVTGRVLDGSTKFSLSVITTQPAAELVAVHRSGRGLRVEGSLCPKAFKRRDAAVIPLVGLVMSAAT